MESALEPVGNLPRHYRQVRSPRFEIAARRLRPTPVFDTYWRFAVKRQALYLARLRDEPAPWTDDVILRTYRFTNTFRVADRVSQELLTQVIYPDSDPDRREADDVVFRILLFKIFNKTSTWDQLEQKLGLISWRTFDFEAYARLLDQLAAEGPIYSAAYMMPPPRLGEVRKHRNHLRLLAAMMSDGVADRVIGAKSLREVYETLISYPSIGRFLAFQFTIDLNYSPLLGFSEDDFIVPGPGAVDGIRKCFGPEAKGIEAEVIRFMVDRQEAEIERLGLEFDGLFGRRLHLIDCQNLFCEVDKYSRVAHPSIAGVSGRTRIKQKFQPAAALSEPFFPPKWRLATWTQLALVA